MTDFTLIHAARRPSDRVYSCIHWTFMGLIAALWLFGQYASRYIDLPRGIGFRLFVTGIVCMNVLWWSVADRRFARHIVSAKRSRWLRIVSAVFSIALIIPLIEMIVIGRFPSFLQTAPTWYTGAVTMWHIGLAVLMPMVAGLRLLVLGVAAGVRRLRPASPDVVDARPVDLTRRALLKTSFATVPMLALTGGSAFTYVQNRRLQVNRREMAAPWLPLRLRGLTITHISDLHVGRLYRPDQLSRLVEMVNKLRSDVIVVTGDIVDVSNDMLPPALDAFGQMHAPHGMFACIGNHDEFDDRAEFIAAVNERFPMLINQRRTLSIGGERITIGGIDWARFDQASGRRSGHHQHVQAMLKGYDAIADGPLITLAHHPHAWDSLALAGVPLTLSGHTHGGQIMLTPPDVRPDLGAGEALFRYIRGIYEKPGSTLFVNRGVGNWFPLRVNSPAEIVQIQLV